MHPTNDAARQALIAAARALSPAGEPQPDLRAILDAVHALDASVKELRTLVLTLQQDVLQSRKAAEVSSRPGSAMCNPNGDTSHRIEGASFDYEDLDL